MKALVLSSGGVDSTTALALAVSRYGKDNVIALSVSYGQKHDKEIQAAKAVSAFYGVEQLFLDLSKIFQYSNCSLLQQSTEEIPEESYARQIEKTEGEKPCVDTKEIVLCHRIVAIRCYIEKLSRAERVFCLLSECLPDGVAS